MADERKWTNIILIILMCFIVVLTLIDISAFILTGIQTQEIRTLTAQIQQQQIGIGSFVSQLQQCENMKDVDKVLKTVNVERIK